MNVESLTEGTFCRHLERRIVERISRGIFLDERPDLILWICQFPLPSLSGIQCPVIAKGNKCPHNGPYSNN